MSPLLKQAIEAAIARTDAIVANRAQHIDETVTTSLVLQQLPRLPPPVMWFGPAMEGHLVQDDVLPLLLVDLLRKATAGGEIINVWLPAITATLREALGEHQWHNLANHLAWVLCADQAPDSQRVSPEYFHYWPWTSWTRRSFWAKFFTSPCKCLAQHLLDHPFELVLTTLYFYHLEQQHA